MFILNWWRIIRSFLYLLVVLWHTISHSSVIKNVDSIQEQDANDLIMYYCTLYTVQYIYCMLCTVYCSILYIVQRTWGGHKTGLYGPSAKIITYSAIMAFCKVKNNERIKKRTMTWTNKDKNNTKRGDTTARVFEQP